MNEQILKIEILDIIKTLQKITDDTQDGVLLICIDMAIQSIINYCNTDEFPKELMYVVVNMVIAETTIDEPVSSISEGGRTVSFDNRLLQARFNDRISNMMLVKQHRQPYRFNKRG